MVRMGLQSSLGSARLYLPRMLGPPWPVSLPQKLALNPTPPQNCTHRVSKESGRIFHRLIRILFNRLKPHKQHRGVNMQLAGRTPGRVQRSSVGAKRVRLRGLRISKMAYHRVLCGCLHPARPPQVPAASSKAVRAPRSRQVGSPALSAAVAFVLRALLIAVFAGIGVQCGNRATPNPAEGGDQCQPPGRGLRR